MSAATRSKFPDSQIISARHLDDNQPCFPGSKAPFSREYVNMSKRMMAPCCDADGHSEDESTARRSTATKGGLNYTAIGILLLFVLPAMLAGVLHVSPTAFVCSVSLLSLLLQRFWRWG